MKLACIFVMLTINIMKSTENLNVPKTDESHLYDADCKPSVVGTPYLKTMEHWKNLSLSDIEGEVWVEIEGYNGVYEASSLGRIKSLSRNISMNSKTKHNIKPRMLRQSYNFRNGYLSVILCKRYIKKTIMVHRIIAKLFCINKYNKAEVNHIDGNKLNNSSLNLEWNSPSENQLHSYRVLNRKKSHLGKFGKDNMLSKSILQYSIDGSFVKRWDSISDVKRILGYDPSGIVDVLKQRGRIIKGKRYYRKTAFGFNWKYE